METNYFCPILNAETTTLLLEGGFSDHDFVPQPYSRRMLDRLASQPLNLLSLQILTHNDTF
jgi:hypothetical protein